LTNGNCWVILRFTMSDKSNPYDPFPDRYTLGFHDEWPDVVTVLADLESSPKADEMALRILRLALDGYSFREIGKMLGISHNTALKKLRDMLEVNINGNNCC